MRIGDHVSARAATGEHHRVPRSGPWIGAQGQARIVIARRARDHKPEPVRVLIAVRMGS